MVNGEKREKGGGRYLQFSAQQLLVVLQRRTIIRREEGYGEKGKQILNAGMGRKREGGGRKGKKVENENLKKKGREKLL